MATLPLYKNHNSPPRLDRNQKPHCGLWWERFCTLYRCVGGKWIAAEAQNDRESSPKLDWINEFARDACGDPAMLALAESRMRNLCTTLRGSTRTFATDWHFVTGLGIDHAVENGFGWHPTLGVPYLPGCAVKGMLRAWLTHWDEEDKSKLDRWLGTSKEAGKFVFFDALPPKPVKLTADVMTPHMGNWYSEGASISAVSHEECKKIPGDWHNPVPVPFLAVQAGQQFVFAVAPKRSGDSAESDRKEVAEVLDQIEQALTWIGAGAKTAVGYGRFERV